MIKTTVNKPLKYYRNYLIKIKAHKMCVSYLPPVFIQKQKICK